MSYPARLTVRLEERGHWPSLWHLGASGWERVESSYDEATGVLSASVLELGRYKVTWDRGEGEGHMVGLVLTPVPNPFRSTVDIRYHLPGGGKVCLSVYDVKGRLVERLFEGECCAGWHDESWDGKDGEGRALPSGIYFMTSQKCLLIR